MGGQAGRLGWGGRSGRQADRWIPSNREAETAIAVNVPPPRIMLLLLLLLRAVL